jgi:hypothetical protein
MTQECDFTVTEREQDGSLWTVDASIEEMFYAHGSEPGYWSNALRWVWLPTPTEPGLAVVAGLLGEGLSLATVDPTAVVAPMLMHRGEIPRCDGCGAKGTALFSQTDRRGMVSRFHSLPEGWKLAPVKLAANYPPRSARQGTPELLRGKPELDLLHPVGALVDNDGIHVLHADADAKLRGWENVASLNDLLVPRYAVREYDLMVVGGDHRNIIGFDEPAQVGDLEKALHGLTVKTMSQRLAAL